MFTGLICSEKWGRANNRLQRTRHGWDGASPLKRVFDRREQSMRERRVKSTTVLTDAEVQQVLLGIRSVFGEEFEALAGSRGIDLEGSVRFLQVAKRCEERRQGRGWSLKEVAKHLRVPQVSVRRSQVP